MIINYRQLAILGLCFGFMIELTGCASMPTPTYVSPIKYQAWDCNQLSDEYNRINAYIQQPTSGGLSAITSAIGVGLVGGRGGIFPSVSFDLSKTQTNSQDGQKAMLMGERNAMLEAARLKNCPWSRTIKPAS